jgi:hypothetical protein
MSNGGTGPVYQQLLLFPERAEYLSQPQYLDYRTRLDHWRELSIEFRRAFQAVYERKSGAVLLVHGAQGTGKTLFTHELEVGFANASKNPSQPDPHNLWHLLAGGDPIDISIVNQVTPRTSLRRITAETGWLKKETDFASQDKHAMRVFVIDDVHKDPYLRELAGLDQGDYLRLKADGKTEIALESAAQTIVERIRGQFACSLFVLLSNNRPLLEQLHKHLEQSHAGLARVIGLPLPDAPLKEEIVRTNTNRLNPRSYWYCLDQGGPNEKVDAYHTLTGPGGFIDSFQSIDRALSSGAGRRAGRPANKNLLTLVTLGAEPIEVESFISDQELVGEAMKGRHIGSWLFREAWASGLGDGSDASFARKAGLLESEFTLRWVVLDARATWCLCKYVLSQSLKDFVLLMPRIGDTKEARREADTVARKLDDDLDALKSIEEIDDFMREFKDAGQGRSREYEKALAGIFEGIPFGKGFSSYGQVKPDLIVSDYKVCAVTSAKSGEAKTIEDAIRRTCHVVEFTAHLQADMQGLREYLQQKVETYAALLETL